MYAYKISGIKYLLADDSHNLPKVMDVKPRLHETTCCQTGCQTGLTTGCIVYTAGECKLEVFTSVLLVSSVQSTT